MAYVEEGVGDPIVLLHGNPSSSYQWRNVIPHLTGLGRCIAPDLVGMGDSAKLANSGPESYRLVEHRAYLDALLEQLGVRERVTLVLHDWGSALGFDWAFRHPAAVRGDRLHGGVRRHHRLVGRLAAGGGRVLHGHPVRGWRAAGPRREPLRRAGAPERGAARPDRGGAGGLPAAVPRAGGVAAPDAELAASGADGRRARRRPRHRAGLRRVAGGVGRSRSCSSRPCRGSCSSGTGRSPGRGHSKSTSPSARATSSPEDAPDEVGTAIATWLRSLPDAT